MSRYPSKYSCRLAQVSEIRFTCKLGLLSTKRWKISGSVQFYLYQKQYCMWVLGNTYGNGIIVNLGSGVTGWASAMASFSPSDTKAITGSCRK